MRLSYPLSSVAYWSRLFGFSRQSYYRGNAVEQQRKTQEHLVVQLVIKAREIHCRLGLRKLLHVMHDDLQAFEVPIGRDRFNSILAANDLLVKPRRNKTRTTSSWAWMRKYPDLNQGFTATASEQLWVADITYLRTEGVLSISPSSPMPTVVKS